jgi:hypothetical protein
MASQHIIRNTYYTFVFNLSDAESVLNSIRHLQIDPRCGKMIGSLPPGKCLFRQASYSSTMLCEIDFVPPARNIGLVKYDTHPFIPPISAEETKKIIDQLYKTVNIYNAEIEEAKQSDVEKIALKLVKLWAEKPFTQVARLFEQLGTFHYTVQIKIREFIEQKKWAEFKEARMGRTTVLLMELNERGYSVLQLPIPKGNKGKGGIIHRHYAMWIKSYFEKRGHKAYLEWIVPGTNHPADIGVIFENHAEIFEICISAIDNLVTHVDVLERNPNIRKLTVIAGTKTELAEIKKFIKSNLLLARFEDRIELNVIETYMERDTK